MLNEYQQAIQQYRQRVYSFVFYSLRSREDAEDVTQDVFIRLWKHWESIDQAKRSAWLMRVAHNAVVDHIRKQQGDNRNLDRYEEVDAQVSNKRTEEALDNESLQDILQGAISALAEPYRSILIMRDIQGQSYSDIEQVLELSVSQVKVYLHRGRKKLRDNPNLRSRILANQGRAKEFPANSAAVSKVQPLRAEN